MPPAGRIVLLNGTTSSGKSSIARELLALLDPPWFHLAVDAFGAMRSVPATERLTAAEWPAVARRTRAGFHRAVAGMAAAGNDVVADHVLTEPWRLDDLLDVFTPYEVLFVGVRCSLAELERRERARGDRQVGAARAQYELVHAHGRYDLEVDSGALDPAACARRIAAALAAPTTGTGAFAALRAERERHAG